MSFLRHYSVVKMSFDYNSACKILFLSVCRFFDETLSLRDMKQNYDFGGINCCGDSYLEFVFSHSKLFRLHAILNRAAGALRSHCVKNPGYCISIGRGTYYCVLGQVTGLPFCLYVKFFLPGVFNFVEFWSIVLDFALADVNVFTELGIFTNRNFQGFCCVPPKRTHRQNKLIGVLNNTSKLCGTMVDWVTVRFPIFFLEV